MSNYFPVGSALPANPSAIMTVAQTDGTPVWKGMVATLQGLLNAKGATLAVDGIFGPATQSALFQIVPNIGDWRKLTWSAVFAKVQASNNRVTGSGIVTGSGKPVQSTMPDPEDAAPAVITSPTGPFGLSLTTWAIMAGVVGVGIFVVARPKRRPAMASI